MGQPIINHQGVAFMLADMAINAEAARALVWKAAWAKDAGERNSRNTDFFLLAPLLIKAFHASMAKAFASKAAVENASLGVQVFGGIGFNTEMPMEKLYRVSSQT